MSFWRLHYDKLIVAGVTAILGWSLVYLATDVGRQKVEREAFERKVASKRPAHPRVEPLDETEYQRVQQRLAEPFQLPMWTRSLWVPERRVWCVACRLPIPYEAKQCPFCPQVQPEEPEERPDRDLDGDGMLDVWELEHGLNPSNPRDAAEDPDQDGFNNLEEFRASTDPRDPQSSPPIEVKLQVEKMVPDPFLLVFMSYMGSEDGRRFALNLRSGQRTWFARMGETVEGFTLVDFRTNIVTVQEGGVARKVDRSEVTLERNGKRVSLVMGERYPYTEYTVHLLFAMEGTRMVKKMGEELELRGRRYRIIEIDSQKEGVVLERLHDGEKFRVWKKPPAEAESPSSDVGR